MWSEATCEVAISSLVDYDSEQVQSRLGSMSDRIANVSSGEAERIGRFALHSFRNAENLTGALLQVVLMCMRKAHGNNLEILKQLVFGEASVRHLLKNRAEGPASRGGLLL